MTKKFLRACTKGEVNQVNWLTLRSGKVNGTLSARKGRNVWLRCRLTSTRSEKKQRLKTDTESERQIDIYNSER